MTTIADSLFSKDQTYITHSLQAKGNQNQYLNQSQKCSVLIPVHFNSKINNNKFFDPTTSDIFQEKKKPWHKSLKNFNFATITDRIEVDEAKMIWRTRLNTTNNNSTLSLHIKAYENSMKDGMEKKKLIIVHGDSTFNVQNPYEFPRQQNDKMSEPEMSQFKASQHLFNPNEAFNYGQQQQQQQSFAPIIPNISRNSYQPAKCGGTPGWNDPPPMNSLPPQKQHSLKKYPRPVDPSIQNNVPPVNQYSQYGYCSNQNTGGGNPQWNAPSNQYSQHGYGSSSQTVAGTQWNVPPSDQHPQYGGNGDGSSAQWKAPSVNQHPQYGYDGNQSSSGSGGAQWNSPPVNQFPQHGYNGNQNQSNNGDGGAYPWNSGLKY